MKTTTFKNILALSACIGVCIGLVSCVGQSSDPMEKYSQLKVSVPTSQTSEHQTIAPDVFSDADQLESTELLELKPKLLELNLQGTSEVNNANFLEEQEGILYFKVTPKSLKITKYSVELTDFTMGSQPLNQRPVIKSTDKANIFGLFWKAPAGIIPAGLNFISLKAKIVMTVTETSDANLKGLIDEDTLHFIVSRNNSVPKILGRSKLDAGIDEGKSLSFSVDIEDPGSAISPRIPEIQITPYVYANKEAFRADGSKYVDMDYDNFDNQKNPERLTDKTGSNKWRFHLKMTIEQLPLDRDRQGIENPMAPSVDVCFNIRAISALTTQSVQQQICLKARYAAQAPVLKWDEGTNFDVVAGKNNILKFKIQSGNDLGETTLKDPAKQIAGLTGTKDLKCSHETSDKLSSQVCELNWAPSCVKTQTVKKLTLKLDNKTGNKSKSQSFTKEFNIIPNEVDCVKKPAPKTTKPAASTDSKTKGA
jgi:hypothetical protein